MMTPKPLSAELTTPRKLRCVSWLQTRVRCVGRGSAAQYVESLGWTIIARNWTCDVGEIDHRA